MRKKNSCVLHDKYVNLFSATLLFRQQSGLHLYAVLVLNFITS